MTPDAPQLPGLTEFSLRARGGFADVWAAREARMDRYVAVKMFREPLTDRAAREQFDAECQAIGRISNHPHIMNVYRADVGDDGRPFIVSELCDSSIQLAVAARGALAPARVAELGLAMTQALMRAHEAGVLHGDVTPSNVLLRDTGFPVLADFGLATLRDHRGNVANGFTLEHAAPETVRHDGAIDVRTDVYGLGSTLYTALTGSSPFPPRPGEPDAERARRILTEAPAPPLAAPGALGGLVLRMLGKDPASRPSMVEVADVLAAGDQTPQAGAPVVPPALPPVVPAVPPAGPPPMPAPPVYLPPVVPGAPANAGAPQADGTRRRAAAGPAGFGPGPTGDLTHVRGVGGAAGQPAAGRSRTRTLVAAAAVAVVVVAGGVTWWLWPSGEQPAAAGGGAVADKTRIQLNDPVDHGTTVDLTWSAPGTLDYAVLVGEAGQSEAHSTLVGRVTSYTVQVEPGQQYCFRVQGSNSAGTVSESNVESVRDAVCRFANP